MTSMLGVITLFPLGLSALVFFYYAAKHRKGHRSILSNFNFLMTLFMGGWFITELLEVYAPPAIHESADFGHFIIMVIFAVGITWRWKWAEKLSRENLF